MHEPETTPTVHLDPGEIIRYISQTLSPPGRFGNGYRGVRNSNWDLAPSLRRYLDEVRRATPHFRHDPNFDASVRKDLKKEFRKYLIVNNVLTHEQADRLDLWQLGRHYGLPCPLLDWTRSPYIALYFSLIHEQTPDERSNGVPRCVWILNRHILDLTNTRITQDLVPQHTGPPLSSLSEDAFRYNFPILQEINPEPNAVNKRMLAQQGFFTFHAFAESVDEWWETSTQYHPEELADRPLLKKITFRPSTLQRLELLDRLNDMNISHATLFPDMEGVVRASQLDVIQTLRRLHPLTTN